MPLSDKHPPQVLEYYMDDSDARIIITTSELLPMIEPIVNKTKRKILVFDNALRVLAMKGDTKLAANKDFGSKDEELQDAGVPGDFYNRSDAMFIYTSGTTSKPKGNCRKLNKLIHFSQLCQRSLD